MTPDEKSLEEIRRLRQEYRRRLDEKLRSVRFVSEDDWIARGLAGHLDGMRVSEEDLLIAVRGTPFLGSYWTGLIVLDPCRVHGRAWINEIIGYTPHDATVQVFAGEGIIAKPYLISILALLQQEGLSGIVPVADRCYDGSPTRMLLSSRKVGRIFEASANASDDGQEPALALARLAWEVNAGIELVEVLRSGEGAEPSSR